MEEMMSTRIELLPDRWMPEDPRCPELELGWAIADLPDSLIYAHWTSDELEALADEKKGTQSSDVLAALDALHTWPPSQMAKALRDAAFKIESLTVKPETEIRK